MTRRFPLLALPVLLMVLATGLLMPLTGFASDTAKEARWAEQIVDDLLDGEPVWLDDGSGYEFLGIMTEGNPDSGRAVILVHGVGVHPNWPDIIYPLRVGLLENDITTLSIQMPILANDAEPEDYPPLFAEVPGRIDAALKSLSAAGYSNVTLVAHSMGSSMAVYYLALGSSNAVDSLVIIGMSPGSGNQNIERLGQLKLPMLDLYGGDDLEQVLASTAQRSAAGKQTGFEYRQVRVDGANHFFQGQEDALLQQVQQWLDAQAES